MPCRLGPTEGRTTRFCCSCLPRMMEVHLEEECHVNLGSNNATDWRGNRKLRNMLRSKVGTRTELFQIYRGKGGDGGVTGRIGCRFSRPVFEISGYEESFYGVRYQDLDLVRRLEALAEHRFGKDLVSAPSFKQRCHETGRDFFMLEFEIMDSRYICSHE